MRSSRSGIGHGHDQRRESYQAVRRDHGGRRRVDDHRAQLDHRHRGYLGLRQVDAAAHDQPARRADPRTSPHRRPRHERGSSVPAAPPGRLRDPGARTLPAPHGPGEHCDRAAPPRLGRGPHRRPGRGAARGLPARSRHLRAGLPAPALGRAAAACRRRARASRRALGAPDGRALRRARPHHPREGAGGPARHSAPLLHHDRARHPRHGRGVPSRRSRGGDESGAGAAVRSAGGAADAPGGSLRRAHDRRLGPGDAAAVADDCGRGGAARRVRRPDGCGLGLAPRGALGASLARCRVRDRDGCGWHAARPAHGGCDPGARAALLMSGVAAVLRLAALGLLLAFLLSPQSFAPLFAPLTQYGAPPIYDQGNLLGLALAHLGVVCLAAAASTLVAVALGILVTRPSGAQFLPLSRTLVNVGQTFPPVAVLAVTVPIVGFGEKPTLIALFAYGLLPIFENTITGLKTVPPQVLEAASGMGMSAGERLRSVELPLAMPLILEGIRLSLVINVGTATIGSTVAAKGLGEVIIAGLLSNNNAFILQGGLVTGLMAVLLYDALAGLERRICRPPHLDREAGR